MKPSYQHRIVAQHLQSKCRHLADWPYRSPAEVESDLCGESLSLSAGDYLVVSQSSGNARFGKVSDLQGLAAFPADCVVIPYHELERAFHEQYSDFAEL